MKLIVGLGNPGLKYEKTRHNVGFLATEQLKKELNFETFKNESKFDAQISKGTIGDTQVILARPQTFMNKSGEAVQKILQFYKITPENCIVICDDLDTEFSKLRIRKKGGPGTHNGLKSIVQYIGTEFPRIRIGIENRNDEEKSYMDAADYVLGKFSQEESKDLASILEKCIQATKMVMLDEIDDAMNKFN